MPIPARQIRAYFNEDSITVYQAYSETIAVAAIQAQRLDASPEFRKNRMTWIKPSWCWMMYRCGYSYKDKGQERVLALRMSHGQFQELLETACLSTNVDGPLQPHQARVQWDPERGPRLEKLSYRSIQIGIPAARCQQWVETGVQSIEDVTEQARELKRVLDDHSGQDVEDLQRLGLLPEEREYTLPERLVRHLEMGVLVTGATSRYRMR